MSAPDPQRTICPRCGQVEPEGADFCECGEYLGWDDPEAPSDDQADAAEPAVTTAPAEPVAGGDAAGSDEWVDAERPPKPRPAPAPAAKPARAATPAPARSDRRPDVASINLRLPDRDHHPGEPIRAKAAPGGSARVVATVRNEGPVVDDWRVTVAGMPDDWWTVKPETVNLLPMSRRGGAEAEVEIELHPPRHSKAEAREWRLEAVATSVNQGAAVTREPFTLKIGAFAAHTLELRPRRSSGRRAGRHELTVHNRGNTHLDVRLEATDQDGVGRFAFAPALVDLEPGEQRLARLEVRGPRPIVAGRDRELMLEVLGHAGEEAPARADAAYRQRAWLPWWALALLAALVVLLAVLLLA